MSKRRTKAQLETAAYCALWQRVADVVSGACGCAVHEETILGAEELSRVVPALKANFLCTEEGKANSYLFEPHCLNHYGSPNEIADFLFGSGVRA